MSPEELLELSLKLSQEKLYIQTERETIARLNQDVSAAAAQVDLSDVHACKSRASRTFRHRAYILTTSYYRGLFDFLNDNTLGVLFLIKLTMVVIVLY